MLQQEQGFVHKYTPLFVKQELEARVNKQYIITITGTSATGKTQTANNLKEILEKQNIITHHINLDKIGHEILQKPTYQFIQKEVVKIFGNDILNTNGVINRSDLSKIVFNSSEKMKELNKLMQKPLEVHS